MSDDTETRTVEIEATARASIREYWAVEVPADFESMSEDEQRDWLDEHPGDCLHDEVEGDEEEREWQLDGPFDAPEQKRTMREILTEMGIDVSREPDVPENRSELSDEEWADVFRSARALIGKWIRDVHGRIWVPTEIDLKDGWPTVGGGHYFARPEECAVIDVAAELASLERLRATDHRSPSSAEIALTQCQHIAHDVATELDEAQLADPLGSAGAALERVREIAERGEADPEFVQELADDEKGGWVNISGLSKDEADRVVGAARAARDQVFTVVGTFSAAEEDGKPRRFAEEYASATGWEGAEAAALEEHPTLDVAAVIPGSIRSADAS